jgi:hypothetical protein
MDFPGCFGFFMSWWKSCWPDHYFALYMAEILQTNQFIIHLLHFVAVGISLHVT